MTYGMGSFQVYTFNQPISKEPNKLQLDL